MASTPLNRILGNSQTLAHLQNHAARLLRLQRTLSRTLPPAIQDAARVANFEDGVLFLHVPSPALATRLKLAQESIRQAMLQAGENVQQIKIKVRVEKSTGQTFAPPRRKISQQGRESLRSLRATLKPDDPLACALQKLDDDSA